MLPVLYEALKVTIQTDLRLNLWQAACWIENYSSNRSIKVIQSDQPFRIFSINASIPQGSILGPLLFSFFIRDPGNECENPLYLYADDSTLFWWRRNCNFKSKSRPGQNEELGRQEESDIRAIKMQDHDYL